MHKDQVSVVSGGITNQLFKVSKGDKAVRSLNGFIMLGVTRMAYWSQPLQGIHLHAEI